MTIDIDSTLHSESIPDSSKNAANFALPSSPSGHSAHFYLGSTSDDVTGDQLLTEVEINLKPEGYSHTYFSGDEQNDNVPDAKNYPTPVDEAFIENIIKKLSSGSPDEISCAAAYICHITYKNEEIKRKVSEFGGISALSDLLLTTHQEVKKHALFALRNLSHDPSPETRKKIDDASLISNLLVILNEISSDDSPQMLSSNDLITESAAATLCNLALYPEFKDFINRNGVDCLIKGIILPCANIVKNQSFQDQSGSSVENFKLPAFIYATGTIRNLIDEDAESRHRLRETPGFVTALIYICSQCIEDYDFDCKALENCVCILRNLSFALQEIRDPAYLIRREVAYSTATTTPMPEKKLEFKHLRIKSNWHPRGIVMSLDLRRFSATNIWMEGGPDYLERPPSNLEGIQGSRLLWTKELVENYISILRHSSNLVTLEAAAGTIQNLTACDWQPSAEVRSYFQNGDNILVLAAPLISEDDGLVQTTATALRNVADQEDLRSQVGFYAMRLLIARLPVLQGASVIDGEMVVPTQNLVSLPTASAILAALYVLVKDNSDRASLFLDCGGVPPCLAIAHTGVYLDPEDPVPSNRDKTVRFARFLLQTLWAQRELRERFKKAGWKAVHFCVREPVVRVALKQSLLTTIRPSAKRRALSEARLVSTPVPLGPINEEGELIKDEEDLLPVVRFSFRG
ncbi:hypothetical protein Aperf_G00000068319 [Anoplocephala perfoliata]